MADIIEISRPALHDQVVARLRALLVEGHIPPGGKLNERELCALVRVSRTPLREAIKLLAAEGMVELLPNRGAVAVQLDAAAIAHTFEVLGGLDALAGELAARHVTEQELAEIRAMHFEMLAAHARRDLSGYYRANAQIHTAIYQAAKNPVLSATYRSINARVESARFRSNQNDAEWQRAVHDHEAMVHALAARDGPALRAVLVRHLGHKRDAAIGSLRVAHHGAQRARV